MGFGGLWLPAWLFQVQSSRFLGLRLRAMTHKGRGQDLSGWPLCVWASSVQSCKSCTGLVWKALSSAREQ